MKYALINPAWSFEGSIYFGCREPHLSLELGYSKALLEESGHEALLIDGHLDELTLPEIVGRMREFAPQFVVVTITAAAIYGLVRFRIPAEVSMVVLGAVAIDSWWGKRAQADETRPVAVEAPA